MAIGSASGQGRQMRFAVGAVRRAIALPLPRQHPLSLALRRRACPSGCCIAPIDLRTADPTVAARHLRRPLGLRRRRRRRRRLLRLRRRAAQRGMVAPAARLRLAAPSARLRHDAVALERAQPGRRMDPLQPAATTRSPGSPEVVARRIMAWLSQTPLLLEGCDYAFYRRFLRSLTRQVRHLRRVAYDGTARPAAPARHDRARRRRAVDVRPAALPQAGGAPPRPRAGRARSSPTAATSAATPAPSSSALIDLLPLRQAFAARGTPALAHPGLGHRPHDADAALLPAGRRRLRPFQRRRRHRRPTSSPPCSPMTTCAARCRPTRRTAATSASKPAAPSSSSMPAAPPPIDFSVDAHAGCLSFEMSVGRQRLIINCGVPLARRNASLRRLARTTAAHSTATLNDTSSCRFLTRTLDRRHGWARRSSPARRRIDIERRSVDGATVLALRHNGYVDRYRIVHERQLALVRCRRPARGRRHLRHADRQAGQPRRQGRLRHPLPPAPQRARQRRRTSGRAVLLELPDGETLGIRDRRPASSPSRKASCCPTRAATARRPDRHLRPRPADADGALAPPPHRHRRRRRSR